MTALEVLDLRFRYPDGTRALDGVSFSVEEGERVAVVGPNGAGKSTLLLHLNGLLPEPRACIGSVRIFGTPVVPSNLAAIRSQVGFLFQDPDDQLFCETVFEDVAFGPRQLGCDRESVAKRVTVALETMRLQGYESRAPHRLSCGEKRRACLAGLIACEPRMLVLDEPTGSLDPRSRRELIGLLDGLRLTQIVATHDLDFVCEFCARVLVLDAGRVVADGDVGTILADPVLMLEHGLEVTARYRTTSSQ